MKSYKDYRFKSVFASKISKISNSELNKYISLAGLDRLKSLMPESVNLGQNPDLIGIAGHLATPNLSNLNGDSITNETGVKIAKNFIWKFANFLHKRSNLCGVVCNSGFSDYVTNKILTEDEVLATKDPVNISVAILLWKSVLSDKFIELLEASVDESSPDYAILNLSWEVYFNDYDIAIGSRNLNDSKIITDIEEKKKYEKYLLSNDGIGKNEDGDYVFRVIKNDLLIPGGVGIVQNQAAIFHNKGLYLIDENDDTIKEIQVVKSSEIPKPNITSNIITSHSENLAVINNDTNNKNNEKLISMTKITKIQDITDEVLKECKADTIRDFIDDEITKASDKWSKERAEKDNALAEVQKKQNEAIANAEKAQKDLETVRKQLEDIQNKVIASEKQEKYNGRMSYFDDTYELDKDYKAILASDLNTILSDEDYEKYRKKMDILLKSQNKETLASQRAEAEKLEKELSKSKEIKESTASTKESTGEKIESALENGEKGANIPNGTTVITSLYDQYKEAFSLENMTQPYKK